MGYEDHSEHGCRQDDRDLEASTPSQIDGVVIGALVALDEACQARVAVPGNPKLEAIRARSTAVLTREHLGRQVALLFEGGDPARPLIVGLIHHPQNQPKGGNATALIAEIDGGRLVLNAEHEIVLRCGKASITLTKAGKVLIQGDFVSSRSSGVNRIKGGSVQIN